MAHPDYKEARMLEEAFFRQRDAELIAEMRRREVAETRKKALAEVSGITDDGVLAQLVENDIHAESLAAFSLVPIIEVAWSDGEIQPAERGVLLKAIGEVGIPQNGVAYRLMERWLERRPEPELLKLWEDYTRAMMQDLGAEMGARVKETVLSHARAVAEAAGGFLGLGRVSKPEEKMLLALEKAFEIRET
jgi:tellurite resistance protein